MIDLLIIGGGPGGYTAAFRAADLGMDVSLINDTKTLGGTCLNVGCIPSKYYLQQAKIINDAKNANKNGIEFSSTKINFLTLVDNKNKIVNTLASGLNFLAKKRKVKIINANAKFVTANKVALSNGTELTFKNAIIAPGSTVKKLNHIPEHPRIITSTEALDFKYQHGKVLIIGAGIIGLEMATIYNAFGFEVTLLDISNQLLPFLDPDIVAALQKKLTNENIKLLLNAKLNSVSPQNDFVTCEIFHNENYLTKKFDFILLALGRQPNTQNLNLENIKVARDENGFIITNTKLQTSCENIFAVGDVTIGSMLAHKAASQAKIAAEVIAGFTHSYNKNIIPSICYTHPEIAWVGLTENMAKEQNINFKVAKFPWAANGKAHAINATSGITKLIFDATTNIIVGGQIIGEHADDLISEVTLAIENNLTAEKLIATIHPHPTLSETILMAAEVYAGVATDI